MKSVLSHSIHRFAAILALPLVATAVFAQEVLPHPPQPFAGKLDPSRENAQPAWPSLPRAPNAAPNIVVVLLDDVGFAASSTFGGVAQTNTLQDLANNGVRYNQFHVTSLCSPTRAALLTGRNHHEAGFGTVADNSSGYPGYNSILDKDTVTVAEVLRQNGYSTAAFGKWHNTPTWEITPAGPYDHWPTHLGFDYFYGFLGGAENQWEPRIWRNTSPVEPKGTPEQGYHLIADMADEATHWVRTHDAVLPDRPFFIWFAPGGTHWPHHVPKDWIARYKGKFDQGWDKLREEIFARQKQLGVIPENAELTPRPPELPAWNSLPADQRKLLAAQAEVSAAYLAYTDFQVGRLIAAVRETGQIDNTLVFYIVGDNGAALNANLLGNDALDANGKSLSVSDRIRHIDELGSPQFNNLWGAAWGWAENTPFQYGKAIPAYLGGVRNPLVVSWPKGIRDKGGLRSQFGHVTDLAPTIYEVTGIKFPEVFEGIRQVPLEGKSLAYSFNDAKATTPRTLQYFEIGGTRGIYKDGWWAGSRFVPANAGSVWNQPPYGQREWELYNLSEDFSQAHNLALSRPEKVTELAALFDQEAWRNDVYPLNPIAGVGRPNPANGRTLFTYRSGVARIPSRNGPDVTRSAHRITAQLDIPDRGAEGVVVANGGRWGGFSLYIQNNKLIYEANAYGNRTGRIVSNKPLPTGKVKIAFEFTPDAAPSSQGDVSPTARNGTGASGHGRLYINGALVGDGSISKIVYAPYESLDIGKDLGSPVSRDYKTPFTYTGALEEVQIELL